MQVANDIFSSHLGTYAHNNTVENRKDRFDNTLGEEKFLPVKMYENIVNAISNISKMNSILYPISAIYDFSSNRFIHSGNE